MEWIDKIDGVDIIYAKDINDIAHLSIDASETAKNVAYIGENGHWFIYNATTKKYVDSGKTAEGKPGESGLPDRAVYTNPSYSNIYVYNNQHVDIRLDSTYVFDCLDLILKPFEDENTVLSDETKAFSMSVSFDVPKEDFTVAFYADQTIVWSGAEPTFTAGYTYFLSFVPLSDTRILGAWSEVPTV